MAAEHPDGRSIQIPNGRYIPIRLSPDAGSLSRAARPRDASASIEAVSMPAEKMPAPVEEPRRAEIVVAVQSRGDGGEAIRAGQRVGEQLAAGYPGRRAVVLLLSDGGGEPARGIGPTGGGTELPILAWSHAGQTAVEATLRAAETLGAAACALVAAAGDAPDGDARPARQLLAPILEDGFDFASPCYATHRFDSVVNTGIIYPVIRSAFGQRIRQPLGAELAVSRRVVSHLLAEGWTADPAYAGDHLWLVTSILTRDFRACQ